MVDEETKRKSVNCSFDIEKVKEPSNQELKQKAEKILRKAKEIHLLCDKQNKGKTHTLKNLDLLCGEMDLVHSEMVFGKKQPNPIKL